MRKPERYFTRKGTYVQEVVYLVTRGSRHSFIWRAKRVPKQYIHKGRKP